MENNQSILQKMILNEEKLMVLYWEYAKAFPLFTKFWNKLAEEEKNHAHMLSGMLSFVDDRETRVDLFRITAAQLDAAIALTENEIKKTMKKQVKSDDAFALALKIENSMLEDEAFSFFSSKDKKIQELLNKLKEDTKRHYETLKRTIDSMK